MELADMSREQLRILADEVNLMVRWRLNKRQLIEALKDPEKHRRNYYLNKTSRRIGFPLIDIHEANPKQGNYIKWWSRTYSRSCTGRFEQILPNGKVEVSWIWDNKRVRKQIQYRFIMDYKDVRTV